MACVLIKEAFAYDDDVLKPLVFQMLEAVGNDFIRPGDKVLIKPNLLMPAGPEQAVTTHPLIVRAAVEFVLDKGGRPQVSDSPAVGNFEKIVKQGGYRAALQGLDVTLKAFEARTQMDIGEPFGTIEIARDALEADAIINLPKLKTHAQMLLTLGVKNMFGCVVGMRKPEWHMRAGVDRQMFARLLVRLYEALAPSVTLIDGILALEGQGPGKGGSPRPLDMLIAGSNAHAVDKVVCLLLALDARRLATCRQAAEMGVFDGEANVSGNLNIVYDFSLPELGPLTFGPPSLARFIRRFGIQRPVPDRRLCRLCGECWNICPAKVIDHSDRGITVNYAKCIRCYCCVEVCPHAAIQAKQPLMGKILRRFLR
jgi:uncharacterized protein (DUF362 family)/Pyruvate/2-oxoacid:ferredoxin oxidoreductase delta subunit